MNSEVLGRLLALQRYGCLMKTDQKSLKLVLFFVAVRDVK